MKKLGKILYYLFLGLIAFVGLVMIFSVFPITDYKLMVVQSGSMTPTIKTGSIVMTVPADNYKKGDIVTFIKEENNEPITHRIHDLEVVSGKVYYLTKGDANNAPDRQKITKDKILGKVLFDIPYLGYAVEAVRKPLGLFLIIVIPAGYLIIDELKKIYKEVKKIKQKKASKKETNS